MATEMLINTEEGHECRIAITKNGRLEELYVERASSASHVGNVYKGKITNVESSIQAAFVDFGLGKNGFLHISDINPTYFPKGQRSTEAVGRKRPQRDRPPIQECLRRGQEVVVQLTKEGIGTKGPTLTTYLSIPGRMLVMMPGMTRLGVSRKVDDEDARAQAKKALAELKIPNDMGFIVRTAGLNKSKRELSRDLNYLLRLWKNIKKEIKNTKAPVEIYQESDLVTRTIRDIYNSDIDRIICDHYPSARKVKQFLDVAMPRTKHVIEVYTGRAGLYHEFGVEEEIERIYSRKVEMASGGSLVIDQTEAMVAIDVNSGRFRKHSNAETTALKINQEAAAEIARQLRLRDLGGLILIDFIDMREDKNRRKVERALRDNIKDDRAKTKVLKMSAFGIIEMTRQRVGPGLKRSIYSPCQRCGGTGLIKSDESQALHAIRLIQRAVTNDAVAQIELAVLPSVAVQLANHQRTQLTELEQETGKRILIRADEEVGDEPVITCKNQRGSVVAWEHELKDKGSGKAKPPTVNIENYSPDADEKAAARQQAAEVPDPPAADTEADSDQEQPKPKSKRRRGGRRRKKSSKDDGGSGDKTSQGSDDKGSKDSGDGSGRKDSGKGDSNKDQDTSNSSDGKGGSDGSSASRSSDDSEDASQSKSKRRRRGRRGGRKHRRKSSGDSDSSNKGSDSKSDQDGNRSQDPSQGKPREDKPGRSDGGGKGSSRPSGSDASSQDKGKGGPSGGDGDGSKGSGGGKQSKSRDEIPWYKGGTARSILKRDDDGDDGSGGDGSEGGSDSGGSGSGGQADSGDADQKPAKPARKRSRRKSASKSAKSSDAETSDKGDTSDAGSSGGAPDDSGKSKDAPAKKKAIRRRKSTKKAAKKPEGDSDNKAEASAEN